MLKTTELDSIIEQVKNQPQKVDLFEISHLIEEAFEVEGLKLFRPKVSKNILFEKFVKGEPVSLTLQAIPEISVTELGWTDIRGEGVGEVSGPEREKLMQFLKNIEGSNFVEKIASLSRFYDNPDAAIEEMFRDDPNASTAKRIAVALSYMVFFKTLTKVISNFNAASAGFNFEAFLAVLTDGRQIPANTGTIADFISRADGTEMPVSLKLYQEKKLHVGGSFNDLVGDLTEPKFDHPQMRYIAVTKFFQGGMKEGLEINGELKWYRFDFTVDNVVDILARSSKHSQKCVLLPSTFISGETNDYAASLPGSALPSVEDMETVFYNAAKVEIADLNNKLPEESMVDEATFDIIMKNLNWSTNDQLFLMWDPDKEYRMKLKAKGQDLPDDYEPQPLQISRGNSRMSASTRSNKEKFMNMLNIILSSLPEEKFPQNNPDTKKIAASIATRFAAANNGWYNSTQKAVSHDQSVLKLYSKSVLNDKRSQELKRPGVFASLADSVKYYNSLPDAEAKKNALKQSYGFLSTEQFNLTQGMIEEIHTYSKNRVLPEGQESSLFGRIQIGNNNTQNMINRMTTILNQSIFEIFTHVKSVQENTYAFVAGGMAENDRADDAIDSSKAIISKTTELKNPT